MLRNFNDLCGSTITVFLYGVAATLGYKVGLQVYENIQAKISK